MKARFGTHQGQLIIGLVSAAASACACLLLYVYYFQSFGISINRLVAALAVFFFLACLVYLSMQYLLRNNFEYDILQLFRAIGFWMIISALFAPHILPVPYYPASTLFRKTSNLEIRINFPEGENSEVQLKGVWLEFDNRKHSYLDFVVSDEWTFRSGRYFIDSGLQGRLTWRGRIAERAKLTIFPMDEIANVTIVWDGEESSSILVDAPISFLKKSATPVWYYGLIVLTQFVVLCYLLFVFFTVFESIERPVEKRIITHLLLVCLSLLLVYAHFQSDDITERFDLQMGYHQGVLMGNAPNPWQYRVLSEWLVAGITKLLAPLGYEKAFYAASLLMRIVQNILIYSMSYSYFRKLKFTGAASLLGAIFLSGSLLNSYYNTGFSLNTYSDVIFYLIAILLVLNRSFLWLPLLMIFAALNRETSALIPLLALSTMPEMQNRKHTIIIAGIAIFCWLIIFIGLRLNYSPREIFVPYGNQPGIPLLIYNLYPPPFLSLFRFFSIVPILGLIVWRQWPLQLKRFFVVMVPVWILVHLVASVISETRLFLVPYVIIFLPAFLILLEIIAKKRMPTRMIED